MGVFRKGNVPGRTQSGIGTVAVPTNSTGAQRTFVGAVKPLGAGSVNPNTLPLTVQRQTPVHPLKGQRYT